MGRINITRDCPDCIAPNFIYDIKILLKNKCRVCGSELNDKVPFYDIDTFMDEYFPQGIPDVIPLNCGDCDYFKKTGWFDQYKGYCDYYEVESYSNWKCVITEVEDGFEEIEKGVSLCPNCNKPQNDKAIFCKDCGTEISPKELVTIAYCDKCESEYDESYNFCQKDGNKLIHKEVELGNPSIDTELTEENYIISDSSDKMEIISEDDGNSLSMKWYKFLTYFLFPVPLIIAFISLPFIDDAEFILGIVVSGILAGVTIYGLHNKTSWSWKLLILTYLVNSLTFRIDRFEDVGLGVYIFGIIIINAIITYPNYIYFSKRKHLFVN